jgi:hypothetical protein
MGGRHQGKYIYDDHSFSFHSNDGVCSANISEVVTPRDATGASWDVAREHELRMLAERGTFDLTDTKPPPGAKVLRTKFVYASKDSNDGKVVFKARLVAMGFNQRPGIDFRDTYSPVVHLPTVRLVAALTAQHSLKTVQIDVLSAFLNAEVKEELYVLLPDGRIVKLKKSLYGLKQAGRNWYDLLSKELFALGFKRSIHDKCLFFSIKPKKVVLFPLHVDDMRINFNDDELKTRLLATLKAKFGTREVTNNVFLGMQYTETNEGILLSQPQYVQRLLRDFRCDNATASATPMVEGAAMDLGDDHSLPLKPDRAGKYREGIGALLYLVNATRPDIACAVGILSRYVKDPTESCFTHMMRVFKYLKGTVNTGVFFSRVKKKVLTVTTDASYGGCRSNARSTTGYLIDYGGPLQWKSIRQRLVVKSATDAEIVALISGIEDATWLKAMMHELQLPISVEALCDNSAAVNIANNEHAAARGIHMNVKYQFLSEAVANGTVKVNHIPGKQNVADTLTKPLGPLLFKQYVNGLTGMM